LPLTNLFFARYNIAKKNLGISNMDSFRVSSYMPKWSGAYQNIASNYNKIMNPAGQFISNCLFEMQNIIAANIMPMPTFDIIDAVYVKRYILNQDMLNTEFGWITNIGANKVASLLNYPFTFAIKNNARPYKFTTVFMASAEYENILLKKPSILYIKPLSIISDAIKITITGLSKDGELISEDIELRRNNAVATMYQYRAILDISSMIDLFVSTYVDCTNTTYVEHFNFDIVKMADKNGSFFNPLFELENNILSIVKQTGGTTSDQHNFITPDISHYFVTPNMDIIYISEGKLCASKMHLPVESNININSSYNNNDMVYIDDIDGLSANVRCTINIQNIKKVCRNKNIQISVSDGQSTTYITDTVAESTDSNTWINIDNRNSNISFSIPTASESIVVKVYIWEYMTYFCAGYTKKSIDKIELCDADSMCIHNNKLYIQDDLDDYLVTPIRGCFTYDDEYIYTQHDFDIRYE
jgi:hypothetical protein